MRKKWSRAHSVFSRRVPSSEYGQGTGVHAVRSRRSRRLHGPTVTFHRDLFPAVAVNREVRTTVIIISQYVLSTTTAVISECCEKHSFVMTSKRSKLNHNKPYEVVYNIGARDVYFICPHARSSGHGARLPRNIVIIFATVIRRAKNEMLKRRRKKKNLITSNNNKEIRPSAVVYAACRRPRPDRRNRPLGRTRRRWPRVHDNYHVRRIRLERADK